MPSASVCPVHGEGCHFSRMTEFAQQDHVTPNNYPSQGPIVWAKPEDTGTMLDSHLFCEARLPAA